ncbi:hypothetical protein CXG81DRAFT_21248, partial [Caulochytrium protostelioides]
MPAMDATSLAGAIRCRAPSTRGQGAASRLTPWGRDLGPGGQEKAKDRVCGAVRSRPPAIERRARRPSRPASTPAPHARPQPTAHPARVTAYATAAAVAVADADAGAGAGAGAWSVARTVA